MNQSIYAEVLTRGITRLCHFTQSRNLPHIFDSANGILATESLRSDVGKVFTVTDEQRFDGHLTHVSCSIEFPNAWYLEKARNREELFKDWVVLMIRPHYLWTPGALFCARNAASEFGNGVRKGEQAFAAMFSSSVTGARGVTRNRLQNHLACSPTDDQAEVLVSGNVLKRDITGIAFQDQQQLSREIVRLGMLNIPVSDLKLLVAPQLFNKHILSMMIRSGQRPEEIISEANHG